MVARTLLGCQDQLSGSGCPAEAQWKVCLARPFGQAGARRACGRHLNRVCQTMREKENWPVLTVTALVRVEVP